MLSNLFVRNIYHKHVLLIRMKVLQTSVKVLSDDLTCHVEQRCKFVSSIVPLSWDLRKVFNLSLFRQLPRYLSISVISFRNSCPYFLYNTAIFRQFSVLDVMEYRKNNRHQSRMQVLLSNDLKSFKNYFNNLIQKIFSTYLYIQQCRTSFKWLISVFWLAAWETLMKWKF